MALKDYGSSKANLGYYDKIINQTDNIGLFTFTSVAKVNKYNQIEDRCDADNNGPVIVGWNPNEPYQFPLGMKLENIKYLLPIIDCAPDFYIVYSEWQESELNVLKRNYDSLPDWQKTAIDNGWIVDSNKKVHAGYLENEAIKLHPQRMARTLGELFKLIIEWDIVSREPFNNTEPAAIISKKILEKLEMPEEVKNELIDLYPDTHVSLYIQGNPNAKERPSGVPNITPLFETWIEEKLLNYQYRGPIQF